MSVEQEGKLKTLKDDILEDISDDAVWFNLDEFGKMMDLNGKKVMAVFTSDTRSQVGSVFGSASKQDGISRSDGVLYLRASDVKGVKAGQTIKLDGRLFLVLAADLKQGVIWRLALEANR